ncbi:hypothetical protein BC833DRAFT_588284 [Globomyces pollinis-pini]|nr:hypothetical protein BC833DRAFT_588284 [Globomyces pollinis-pini]
MKANEPCKIYFKHLPSANNQKRNKMRSKTTMKHSFHRKSIHLPISPTDTDAISLSSCSYMLTSTTTLPDFSIQNTDNVVIDFPFTEQSPLLTSANIPQRKRPVSTGRYYDMSMQDSPHSEASYRYHNRNTKTSDSANSCLRICVFSILLFAILVSFTVLTFCFQPLSNVELGAMTMITRTEELFEFDLQITGTNSNIIPAFLESTDFEVYASVGDHEYPLDSTSKYPAPLIKHELLGHVRSFNLSVVFPPVSSSTNIGKIAIEDPSNTLGKLIYLTLPFTLSVEGYIWYTSIFRLTHQPIPICRYYFVTGEGVHVGNSCLDE